MNNPKQFTWRILSILFTLLLSFNASSADYLLQLSYAFPTERENNELLVNGDLTNLKMYEVDCITKEHIRKIYDINGNYVPGSVKDLHYILSDTPTMCLALTVTSVEGLESRDSNTLKAYDFRTPNKMECLQ